MANRFKKGDNVIVIAGSNRGKQGKIIAMEKDKVIVRGLMLLPFIKNLLNLIRVQYKKKRNQFIFLIFRTLKITSQLK